MPRKDNKIFKTVKKELSNRILFLIRKIKILIFNLIIILNIFSFLDLFLQTQNINQNTVNSNN